MTLDLYKPDTTNLREILKNASTRHKAPAIRAVLRRYAVMLTQQREATKRKAKLKLIEESMDGSQQVLVDRLDLEV